MYSVYCLKILCASWYHIIYNRHQVSNSTTQRSIFNSNWGPSVRMQGETLANPYFIFSSFFGLYSFLCLRFSSLCLPPYPSRRNLDPLLVYTCLNLTRSWQSWTSISWSEGTSVPPVRFRIYQPTLVGPLAVAWKERRRRTECPQYGRHLANRTGYPKQRWQGCESLQMYKRFGQPAKDPRICQM